MNQRDIFIGILIVLVIGVAGYFAFVKNQAPTPQTQQVVFASQEECEQKTGKPCSFQMCDYIPPGKTFEEVCGKNFKKGWVSASSASSSKQTTPSPKPITPTAQNPVDSKWKTFQNSRFTFQFEYPVEWSVLDKVDDPYGVQFWSAEKNTATMIMDIETGINLSLIGISYCGAYPQDERCESLKTENSGYVTIDWDVSGKANAMVNSQDGTYGVSFTLHKINSETKNIFRKILSTFKFLK